MSSQKRRIVMAKVVNSTNHNLASAYDLVLTDLFSNLKKMKEGVIKLGDLGNLSKKQRLIKRSPLTGKSYLYYQVSFKASKELKKELDK
jgi:nucleoid DNA-binding protein